MKDINRRKLLKRVGVASGVGASGIGFSGSATANTDTLDLDREQVPVSETGIKRPLESEESRVVLEKISVETLDLDTARGYEIRVAGRGINRVFHEIVAPASDGGGTFSYVQSEDVENVASFKTAEGELIRATAGNEIRTEVLEFGDEITNGALKKLNRGRLNREIETSEISTLDTGQASSSFDKVTGTTHLFVPATTTNGEHLMVYANISASGTPDSVHVMDDDYWACVSTCVAAASASIGTICWNTACGLCAGGVYPSCAACLGCAGAVVGACAGTCAI